MGNEARHDQTEAGDPFSVFGEIVYIKKGLEAGIYKYRSKIKEGRLAKTVMGCHPTEDQTSEFLRIAREAAQISTRNLTLRNRVYEIESQIRGKSATS